VRVHGRRRRDRPPDLGEALSPGQSGDLISMLNAFDQGGLGSKRLTGLIDAAGPDFQQISRVMPVVRSAGLVGIRVHAQRDGRAHIAGT